MVVMVRVQEMFVSICVRDMERAVAFYENALGAVVDFASPSWCSLTIAGMRVSLELCKRAPTAVGLHFIVENVALACAAVTRAGGEIEPAFEAPRGVVVAQILDSEGNTLTLRQRRGRQQLGTLPYGVACVAS
jgi:predicted enzyme related to lactoylglutathione lyase